MQSHILLLPLHRGYFFAKVSGKEAVVLITSFQEYDRRDSRQVDIDRSENDWSRENN